MPAVFSRARHKSCGLHSAEPSLAEMFAATLGSFPRLACSCKAILRQLQGLRDMQRVRWASIGNPLKSRVWRGPKMAPESEYGGASVEVSAEVNMSGSKCRMRQTFSPIRGSSVVHAGALQRKHCRHSLPSAGLEAGAVEHSQFMFSVSAHLICILHAAFAKPLCSSTRHRASSQPGADLRPSLVLRME